MSNTSDQTWYVYRHALPPKPASTQDEPADPVLKSSETSLAIKRGDSAWLAYFELLGREEPIEVERSEVSTSSWQGATERFAFRWNSVPHGGSHALIGETFRKGRPDERRDFFIALPSRTTDPLPRKEVYYFAEAYLTPFEGQPRKDRIADLYVHRGNTSTSRANKIHFHDMHSGKAVHLKNVVIEPDASGRGIRVVGSIGKGGEIGRELGIWILPGNGGGVVATGYYFDSLHFDKIMTKPYETGCTNRFHALGV